MIFLQLFYTFLYIGAFTFGGGYSMVALIQDEVVRNHHWLTDAQFADLLAVSQSTPGPIGINTATYTGYLAVAGAGYPQWAAVLGSLLASLAVIAIPVALILTLCRLLQVHRNNPTFQRILIVVKLAVIGLIAAAALRLANVDTFGLPGLNRRFVVSVAIFAAVFLLAWRRKASPILLIIISGLVGLVVYSIG